MDSLVIGLLDELCDKLDESGIEGNVIERDSYGKPYVTIWYGSFEDHDLRLPEAFTVVITDYSFYFGPNCTYEIKPPEKYSYYFKNTFMARASRKAGFYVMSLDRIVRTITFLFNIEKMEKKKKNNMYSADYNYPRQYASNFFTILMKEFAIKDVIFNDPATIIIWADGSKTVVKAENEPFDPEKGLAMAISKKVLGNKYDYYDIFKKYVGRYEKKQKKGKK